ncbi:hypothetical protein ABPG74_003156 [Tetrahymena malaccensis]
MANAQHFQELISILQQDGIKRSDSELYRMIEICNKQLDFFQKYNLKAFLADDQILDFYKNLSLFKFKVPKKQSQKPKQLQAEGLLFLLEGELSRYIVNIRNESQQENEKNANNEPLYSLQSCSPGDEIGQIMDSFKKSQAFRIEFSCIKDCLFMKLNQGYFQQYLEQQLRQFNQSQVYFLRDISYFSHFTRDEIMLIYMTSKFQQNLKGDMVHNPQKYKLILPGTIKIILEGEFLARCQVQSQANADCINSQKTDLSSLQKITSKKNNIYNSLFLQSPFDFFGLEYFNFSQSENIPQENYNYEIICHSQSSKILCIYPSIIQVINNNNFEKQMIQIKSNQMNLIKTKLSKILDIQSSINKSKKRSSKIEQKSLSSLEVPVDIQSSSPQKSQNNLTLKNQTSSPSQIVLPAVFQDEIMLNALSSIKSIKDLSHNNQNYAKKQTYNKDSNEILKNSNTIDVVSAFKQNRKDSLINETETKNLNEQKSNLQLKNKHKNDLNQKSVDYISYDQINKQIETIFNQEKQSSEYTNLARNQKNLNNENQLQDKQNSLSLNKRNSQSYRKNTHFFVHHLKKTIDNGNQIHHQKQNLSNNELNQLNPEDQFFNKNISFQYLLPHVESIQNLAELSNNKSRDELKIKKKKSIYQYENQNMLLPKLNELKQQQQQQQNYYHANFSSKKEISKLYLQNLDLSSLNEDTQLYNIKQDKANNSIIHQNDQIIRSLRKKIEEENSLTQRKKVASCHENSQSLLQKQFQNKIYTRKKIMRQEEQSIDKKLSVDKSARRELSIQENKIKKKEQQENKRFYLLIDQSLRQKIEFDSIKNTLLKHTNNKSYTDIVSSKLESQKERSPQQSSHLSEKKNSLSKNLNKLIDQIHNSQNQKKITVNQSQKYYDGLQNNSIVLSKQIDLNLTQI